MVERTGLRKGTTGASKGWFYVGTGLWTLRTVRKFAARKEEVLVSEKIRPGDRVLITNTGLTVKQAKRSGEPLPKESKGRKGRKAAAKARKRAAKTT